MRSDLVLVCDPSPQAQRALRVILRSARYEVVMTATGRDALDAAARERPQAVILELALPDFDGIEVLSPSATSHRGTNHRAVGDRRHREEDRGADPRRG